MLARHRALLLSGTAALLAVGLTASAAYAAGSAHPAGSHRATAATWSVSVSEETGGGAKVVVIDHTTGTKIKCSAQFDYSLTQKMGLPSDIATVSPSFGTCTLPGGTAITLTANTATLPMMALSFNPRRNLGVTTGAFTGLDISISGSGCSGVLDGTAAGANDGTVPYRYFNNPNLLVTGMPGNLHSYNVTGCTGLFSTGDSFTISYSQDFSDLYITSP
jgi:hypothetical protein